MDNDKIYLNVPYKDKELAKSLGARWDNNKKKWYTTKNSDLFNVYEWRPSKVVFQEVQKMIDPERPREVEPNKILNLLGDAIRLKYCKSYFCIMCDTTRGDYWYVVGASEVPERNIVGCQHCNENKHLTLKSFLDSGMLKLIEYYILLESFDQIIEQQEIKSKRSFFSRLFSK